MMFPQSPNKNSASSGAGASTISATVEIAPGECSAGCAPVGAQSCAVPTPCGPTNVSVRERSLREVAERFKIDQGLIAEVLATRPRGLIPLVTPFGCYELQRSQPEKTNFGTAWDPVLRLMLGGVSTPDQELSVTGTQGVGPIPVGPTTIATRIAAGRSGSYPIIGCRIYFATTAQQAPINSAETTWRVAPYNYNANGTTLRATVNTANNSIIGLDDDAVLYDGNRQKFSMGAQQTGGAYVFFASRDLANNLAPDYDTPVTTVDVTIPTDVMIRASRPAVAGDDTIVRSPYRELYIDTFTTGLVTGAQISQSVTVIAPGQPYFEECVTRMLEMYYTTNGVSWSG